jgi:hypothetical protein
MMNKGFEVMEAKWLFGVGAEDIEVVVHPQSVIHSMVQFGDGAIKAQLGTPDMRLPIMYALTYPARLSSSFDRIDWNTLSELTFEKPNLELFPNLQTIAAHFGGYTMYETAREYLYDTNCIMDISSSLMFMPQGIPEQYIRLYGTQRMAYGTDYPLWDPVHEVEQFMKLKLTDEEREQIAWKTASDFLNL